jgi:cellulose synthase/poly-beta-1,6-N-acetylglucosamine synthase-like glycosyltransferase
MSSDLFVNADEEHAGMNFEFESPLRILCPSMDDDEDNSSGSSFAGGQATPSLLHLLEGGDAQVTRQVTRDYLRTARSSEFGAWLETSRSRGGKGCLVDELDAFMALDRSAVTNLETHYGVGGRRSDMDTAQRNRATQLQNAQARYYLDTARSREFASWLGGQSPANDYDQLSHELEHFMSTQAGSTPGLADYKVGQHRSVTRKEQMMELQRGAIEQCLDTARSREFNSWLEGQSISRDYDQLLDRLTAYIYQTDAAAQPHMALFLQELSANGKGERLGSDSSLARFQVCVMDDRADSSAEFRSWLGGRPTLEDSELMTGLQAYLQSHSESDVMQPVLQGNLSHSSLRRSASFSSFGEDRLFEGLVSGLERNLSNNGEMAAFGSWATNGHMAPSPTSSLASTVYREDFDEGDVDEDTITPETILGPATTFGNPSKVSPLPRSLPPLPTNDRALEEAANWLATEDEDFITPWYTYAMRVLMFPLGALIFYFIYWRWYNYPRSGIWWSDMCAYTFIVSEQVCFLFAMTHWVWMWNLKFRKRVTMQELNISDEDLPTIDILIPCYSEPTEIVEMTLKACYDMDYPAHKITCWVCDDGKSEEMRDMVSTCQREYRGEMSTRYVARIKIAGIPHHAKAGNLNNIILNTGSGMGEYRSSGQLLIVLDCDMIPEPCLARTVAPFFFKKLPKGTPKFDEEGGRIKAELDPTVGLLQTPQAFYNLDTNDLLGQSYAFFYECQMTGWDGSGCTPCCGTGVTFSRVAMEAVGGFSIGSITEDFKTSLNMCANGFQCKYFLQRMTRGVSPKELNAFMIQRMRWAVGAIQILRSGNPLFIKGLHAAARWLYFFSTVGIMYILFVVAMGLIMYSTILAGAPISFGPTTFTQYLYIGGSAVGLMMFMQVLAGWRLSWRNYLRALQDNFTVFWTMIRAMVTGFLGIKLGFAVTAKDVSFDLRVNLSHAAPHICVYIFSGVAMLKGTIEMLSGYGLFEIPWESGYNVSLLYFSWLWTIFLWVMISGPPRMVIYGWRRARKEAAAAKKGITCTNSNVPALQELPSTPVATFPPLDRELWSSRREELSLDDSGTI